MKVFYTNYNPKNISEIIKNVIFYVSRLPIQDVNKNAELEIIEVIRKFYYILYFHDKIDHTYKVNIGFETENGKEEVDLFDRPDIIIQKLFTELKRTLTLRGLQNLINISNNLLITENIDIFNKIAIVDAENIILGEQIDQFIDTGDEKLVKEFVNLRIEVSLYLIENRIKNDDRFNDNIDIPYNIFSKYLQYKINFYIYRNQIFQAYNYLKDELEKNEGKKIRKVIIQQLVNLNSSFQIERKSICDEILDNESDLFSEDELKFLKMRIDMKPSTGDILQMKIAHGSISKKSVEGKEIFTIIRFSLSFRSRIKSNGYKILKNNDRLDFNPLTNRFSDPILKLYKNIDIGGMGWNFFLDSYASENYCTFAYVIPRFYHPDFTFDEKGDVIETNFSKERAITGREYYPHKELIINSFLDNFEIISEIIEVKKNDIDINLFSNYVVDFLDKKNNSIVYRRLLSITNPDSFTKAKTRFLERLSELNLTDAFLPIRKLVDNTPIITDVVLRNFMCSLIDIILKNGVEEHSVYKYFWREENCEMKPLSEPQTQPLIYSHLKAVCDYVGIQLSREVKTGNGSVDFFSSYTYNSNLLKTCIELKNAHNPDLELGLTKQLVEYLKGERTKYGIFLVLWYKGDDFNKPAKFNNIEELKDYLDEKRPKGYKIEIIIIDCSKPIMPSKLK